MKSFDKNGYKISEMTLGTVQLGLNYGINNKSGKPSADTASEILKTAEECGITTFDTAAAYGDSECVIGEYFSKSENRRAIVTKAHFDDVSKAELFDVLVNKAKLSAERLRIGKLPFFMLHNESYIKKYGTSIINALVKLKNEGFVEHIGASFSDKTDILNLCDTDAFDCIQVPLNIFDSKEISDGSVKKLSESGVTVFVRSVYLQGLFFMNPDDLPKKLSSAREPISKLRKLSEAAGMSIGELALSFIRSTEGVGSIVLGCETAEQVRENAKMFGKEKLSEELRGKVLEAADGIDPVVIRPWEWKL